MSRPPPTHGPSHPTLLLALVLVGAPPLAAQTQVGPEPVEAEPPAITEDGQRHDPPGAEDPGWWRGFRGAPEPTRVYLGIWALHLKRMEDGLSAHHLVGVSWRGFYLGTFVNTHERRTWSGGVGRSMVTVQGSDGGFSLGYRAGFLRGYDHRLMEIAERWPAIPAAQIVADARYRRVGMQAGWSWIVVTFGGYVEF